MTPSSNFEMRLRKLEQAAQRWELVDYREVYSSVLRVVNDINRKIQAGQAIDTHATGDFFEQIRAMHLFQREMVNPSLSAAQLPQGDYARRLTALEMKLQRQPPMQYADLYAAIVGVITDTAVRILNGQCLDYSGLCAFTDLLRGLHKVQRLEPPVSHRWFQSDSESGESGDSSQSSSQSSQPVDNVNTSSAAN